jgi:putative PIN family toxin of toxin-antitoxin system
LKVVFDTNILLSGFLTTAGISQYVLSLALKRHTVILSEFILEELMSKSVKKIGIPADKAEAVNRYLRSRTQILNPPVNPQIHFSDKKDLPLLSLAEAAGAHYLVTGDKEILKLKKIGKTLILSAREALEAL